MGRLGISHPKAATMWPINALETRVPVWRLPASVESPQRVVSAGEVDVGA